MGRAVRTHATTSSPFVLRLSLSGCGCAPGSGPAHIMRFSVCQWALHACQRWPLSSTSCLLPLLHIAHPSHAGHTRPQLTHWRLCCAWREAMGCHGACSASTCDGHNRSPLHAPSKRPRPDPQADSRASAVPLTCAPLRAGQRPKQCRHRVPPTMVRPATKDSGSPLRNGSRSWECGVCVLHARERVGGWRRGGTLPASLHTARDPRAQNTGSNHLCHIFRV